MTETSVSSSSCRFPSANSPIDPAVAEARPHADGRRAGADDLVLLFQAELHLIFAGRAVRMVGGEAALDLGLAGFVRIAVGGIGRTCIDTPLPLDGGAIELFAVVGAPGEIG